MLRASAIDNIHTLLFGGALLSLVLGFGMFFDHLADADDRSRPVATAAYGYDQLLTPRLAGVILASYEPEDFKALAALRIPPEFIHDHLHPPRAIAPAGTREWRPL